MPAPLQNTPEHFRFSRGAVNFASVNRTFVSSIFANGPHAKRCPVAKWSCFCGAHVLSSRQERFALSFVEAEAFPFLSFRGSTQERFAIRSVYDRHVRKQMRYEHLTPKHERFVEAGAFCRIMTNRWLPVPLRNTPLSQESFLFSRRASSFASVKRTIVSSICAQNAPPQTKRCSVAKCPLPVAVLSSLRGRSVSLCVLLEAGALPFLSFRGRITTQTPKKNM